MKINLNGEKDKPDVKPKTEPDIMSNKEDKQDVKIDLDDEKDKPVIKANRENKQDVKITYEEEKAALVLGITSIFTVWWMFK